MRDAIAWSHDLLILDEQVLFRRLSLFMGGFDLEAAEQLGGALPETTTVFDGIASRVEKACYARMVRSRRWNRVSACWKRCGSSAWSG
jgi:predicted ATPase